MSNDKLDIPQQFASPAVPALLTEDSVIRFQCYKGISCFNACCKHADVTLAPYDVLRLQKRLGMNSEEFLKKHTVPFQLDADGVPGIKLRTDNDGACLLLDGDNGCGVYEDRPTVCRYYPIALLNMREKDTYEAKQQYSLVQEDHCKGHDEAREITLRDYRKEQGVAEYDDFNRSWYELILKKKSGGPGVGKPNEMSLQLFFMASFNFDMLRRFVLSDNFKQSYNLPPETYTEVAEDDIALIKLGNRLMRQALFGEKTIPENSGAWEQRVESRKEIWEARSKAEVEARNAKAEADMRQETTGCSDN
ncbi:MAG: YkgJ family cysteine cluster protein [Chromatiales bacterium]|nr:YkgJ family cysteine cluster protein [Chromatiales bacterium]